MTEKKYIIDEWDVAEIALCAEKACDQKLAEYFRSLKPVELIKNKTRDLIIHKAVTAYEIFDLIELHYFGELK